MHDPSQPTCAYLFTQAPLGSGFESLASEAAAGAAAPSSGPASATSHRSCPVDGSCTPSRLSDRAGCQAPAMNRLPRHRVDDARRGRPQLLHRHRHR